MHICIHMYIHIYVHVYICTYIYICICIHTYIYKHIYINIYTFAYIHVYMCVHTYYRLRSGGFDSKNVFTFPPINPPPHPICGSTSNISHRHHLCVSRALACLCPSPALWCVCPSDWCVCPLRCMHLSCVLVCTRVNTCDMYAYIYVILRID